MEARATERCFNDQKSINEENQTIQGREAKLVAGKQKPVDTRCQRGPQEEGLKGGGEVIFGMCGLFHRAEKVWHDAMKMANVAKAKIRGILFCFVCCVLMVVCVYCLFVVCRCAFLMFFELSLFRCLCL